MIDPYDGRMIDAERIAAAQMATREGKPSTAPQVSVQLKTMVERLGELEEIMHLLENKIESVLRPVEEIKDAPTRVDPVSGRITMIAPLAIQLCDFNDRIKRDIKSLQWLCDRIEL